MPTSTRLDRTGPTDLDAPAVVVVCGLPGVGKTSVAELVADRLGGALHRTDVVRTELVAEPAYTERETRRVYAELLDRGRETVAEGGVAVLDGTFRRADQRRRALVAADRTDAAFELVKVECATDVVEERISRRTGDASDADFEVHLALREEFEPVTADHVTVDNSGDLGRTREQVREHF